MNQGVPPYRPFRSRKPVSFAAILFLVFFFTGILLLVFLKSPFSEIQEIEVVGNRMVPEQEVLDRARLKEGTSYFRWDEQRAERELERMIEIDRVTVIRSFPGGIRIDVREVPRAAYWNEKGKTVPVLADGTILRNRTWTGQIDRPLLRGWKSKKLPPALTKGLSDLPENIRVEISEIRPGSDHTYPDLIKAYTRQGHIVRVRARDFGEKMKYYSVFRDRPPGTLNLLESTWFIPEKTDGGS
ncbi:cell division protein FtsQ/DivIB [Salinithrix halophila]|uniref:Cell division protein FtsQ/DivIB n=1 Tax=Salinithrix halophila TaxID=1485204 RepID=A0ABV8JIB7_9BACL